MKDPRQKNWENWLLLKSCSCVLLIGAAVLLMLRHAEPVEEDDKSYGGGVSLLLALTPEERSGFSRWMELNDPSRIFGYNSAGIFSRSVEKHSTLVLPVVRVSQQGIPDMPFFRPTESRLAPLKFEERSSLFSMPQQTVPAAKTPFVSGSLPVYDEKGTIVSRLQGIPDTNMINALLIRVSSGTRGSEFRIVESSGDRRFDSSVAQALGKLADEGKVFSGTLAVWPDSKEIK